MLREERPDAGSRVSYVIAFVTRTYDDTEHPDQALVFVEEGMPGIRIFLHVMLDLVPLERALQPRGGALKRPVAAAEARDHRTGAVQDPIDVVRGVAVVRSDCRKAVAGREQDRKIAGRAEADDPGFAGAVLAAFQPLPHGINIVKR